MSNFYNILKFLAPFSVRKKVGRKAREISFCRRNCSQGRCSYIDFPLNVHFFLGIQKFVVTLLWVRILLESEHFHWYLILLVKSGMRTLLEGDFYILSETRMLRNDYFMFFFKTVVCKSPSKTGFSL